MADIDVHNNNKTTKYLTLSLSSKMVAMIEIIIISIVAIYLLLNR